MHNVKKKGFTLIELIAVLVIMAIIALIATPLVMSIIRSARISADKRSIDAYGRSIELAIAGYLLDNGKFPTDVSQLTVEYSGNQVACETTQLNSDSSVYLAGCRVAGRSVGDYIYGVDKSPSYTAYTIGDQVTYNDIDFYVIKDSGIKEDTVTLLKAEPLSYSDIQIYSAGTGAITNNDDRGHGRMQYHSSSNAYEGSYVKITVEAWAADRINSEDLVVDSTGYSVRLLSHEELITDLGYYNSLDIGLSTASSNGTTPDWVYNCGNSYWTMSLYGTSTSNVWGVGFNGGLYYYNVDADYVVVRPVITILKSALQ